MASKTDNGDNRKQAASAINNTEPIQLSSEENAMYINMYIFLVGQ